MAAAELRFSLLGPVRAWSGHTELNLGTPQQRAVLAVLLLAEGRHVSLQALIEMLWDEPPATAAGTVRTYVSRLRRELSRHQAQAIESVGDGYLVRPGRSSLDLAEFRELAAGARAARGSGDTARAAAMLRDALPLWQGTPLSGLPGGYAEAQRVRLGELRLAAQEERLELETELGGQAAAAAELQDLAASHPLRERVLELLMLALYRSGRQADALAVYTAARRRLRDCLGVDPGPALQRLHQRILRADPELMPARRAGDRSSGPAGQPGTPAPGLAPAPPAVHPAQLPASLPAFTGRQAELGRLDALLAAAQAPGAPPAVAVIGGMGGVGKTALAVHWAHRAAERFPGGQLYVNLRGFSPDATALAPAEALRGFLLALGTPPHLIPHEPDAQAALYRSLLRGHQVVIVLDNARDAGQVRPLLPGSPGCAAVVTSRNPLAGLVTADGAHPLTLSPFTADEARAALAARLGPSSLGQAPAAVSRILESCAGLPLALAAVAARAAFYPATALTSVASQLQPGPGQLAALSADGTEADVRQAFSWSYRQLSEHAARAFRLLLPLYPGPDFGLDALARLIRLPAPQTAGLLAELTAAGLVSEHRPGRFTVHKLLQVYAAELSDAHNNDEDRQAGLPARARPLLPLGVRCRPAA